MRLEVMDALKLFAERVRERLAEREPDEQRADEAWAARGGDEVERLEGGGGPSERRLRDRGPVAQMLARGDLGHDAAERTMHELARDDRRQHPSFAVHDRARGVVARGLDAEDERPVRVRSVLH